MKRSIRILAGIAVMLAMVFFYGVVAPGGALADDATEAPAVETATASAETPVPTDVTPEPTDAPADTAAPSASETPEATDGSDQFKPNEKHMKQLNDKYGIDLADVMNSKMATGKPSVITSNRTLTGTYGVNLQVNRGVTVTVKTNVTINGDLYMYGRLNITSGTLTINGDLLIEPLGSVYVSGTGKIVVNKSARGGVSGQPGGRLGIIDEDYDAVGLLSISGTSASVTVNNPASGFFIDTGALKISSGASLILNTPLNVFDGIDTDGQLNSGSITIYGAFIQDVYYSLYSYSPGPGFLTRLVGTSSVPKYVLFNTEPYPDDPDYHPVESYFTKLSMSGGFEFDSTSVISICEDLSASDVRTINFNDAEVWLQGNLNGGTLNLSAGYMYIPRNETTGDDTLNLNGGNLNVDCGTTVCADGKLNIGGGYFYNLGDLTIQGSLRMNNHQDRLYVGGSFITEGIYNSDFDYNTLGLSLTDGRLFIEGNLSQAPGDNDFMASGSHTTILCGTGSQQVSFATGDSKFAHLVSVNPDITSAASISLDSSRYDDFAFTGTSLRLLNVNTGNMSSMFDSAVREYTLYLLYYIDDVTFTLLPPEAYGTNVSLSYTLDGGATWQDAPVMMSVNDIAADSNTTFVVKVTPKNSVYNDLIPPGAPCTYTVVIKRTNPYLKSLGTLPAGSDVSPAFDKGTADYEVQLPETAESFTFAPQLENPESTLSVAVDGQPAGTAKSATVALNPGETRKYDVYTTAQDGLTKEVYTVTFTRRYPVLDITATTDSGELTLDFKPETANYDVYVPVTVASVDITVTAPRDGDCSDLRINDAVQQDNKITLSPAAGGTETATIAAKDKDGKATTTYTVTVHRVKPLTGITLSTGTLSPAFDASVYTYKVYVPYTTASVKVTPAKSSSSVAMKINGAAVSYYTLTPAAGSSQTVTIACTVADVTQTYTVTVYRVMPLSKISVSTGALTPAFSAGTYSYLDSVPATAASVTVSVTKTASLVSMKINGKAATFVSGIAAVKLAPAVGGSASAKIEATAVDGRTYTYTVTVKRAALITGITTSASKLTPSFSATRLNYTVANVSALTSQVKIAVVKAKTGVRSVAINGRRATYAYIKPPVGGSATATIVVLASDGRTKVTYKVTVKRNGLLSGIKLSTGKLSPAFSVSTPAYTVNVPADTPSVTVTPVKASGAGVITINGKVASSVTLKPSMGGYATATIVVTGTDRRAKQTYTVKVVRHAPLKGIALAGGVLSPAFNPTVHAYNVTMPVASASVTITPLRFNTLCSYSINGGTPNTPYSAELDPGESETVTIVATASDHVTKLNYTLTVSRAPLLSGITVSEGTLTFAAGQTDYNVTVPSTASEVVVTPVPATGCTLSIDGDTTATKATLYPVVGANAETTIVVTAADGVTKATYKVTVMREPALGDLQVVETAGFPGSVSIDPDTFDATHLDYTVTSSASSVSISVVLAGNTSASIGGTPDLLMKRIDRMGGESSTIVTIVVTPGNSLSAVTYTVTINWTF